MCQSDPHPDAYGNINSYTDGNSDRNTYTHTNCYPDAYTYTNSDSNGQCDSHRNADPDCDFHCYAYSHAGPDHTQRPWLQSAGSTKGRPLMDRSDFKWNRHLPQRRVDRNGS